MIMSRRILCRLAGIVAALLAWGSPQTPAQAQGGDVLIFAAASLKNALDAISAQWQKDTGKKARISYRRARPCKQTEQGAPAQIFISADLDWMDYLAARHLIKSDTRSNLLGKRIVLVAPKQGPGDRDQAGVRAGQGFG
jgi:molybdate transport system substrate-binding protein